MSALGSVARQLTAMSLWNEFFALLKYVYACPMTSSTFANTCATAALPADRCVARTSAISDSTRFVISIAIISALHTYTSRFQVRIFFWMPGYSCSSLRRAPARARAQPPLSAPRRARGRARARGGHALGQVVVRERVVVRKVHQQEALAEEDEDLAREVHRERGEVEGDGHLRAAHRSQHRTQRTPLFVPRRRVPQRKRCGAAAGAPSR